jgi:hypothetical protein
MNTRTIQYLAAAFGLVGMTAAAPLLAADYYVDQTNPKASDTNPGTEALPWSTLYKAARAPLQPGDTVYVKQGSYDVSTGGMWNSPAINLPSGAPGKPITFKSLPMHAAVLNTYGTQGNPAIGVYGRSHVVIDGFVIPKPGNKGIAIFGEAGAKVKDIVIQNNIIHGVYVDALDNTEAIRLENAEDVLVRNNKIYDVRNGGGSSNASGVKTYKVKNVIIENNEMYDVIAGVKEKEASSWITVRNNKITNCRYGFVLNNQNGGVTEQIRYHNNVVECSSGFETASQSSAIMRDVYIYNNTFSGYSSKGVHTNEHGQQFYIYNNIFSRTSPSISMADFFTRHPHTNQISLMDYNLYQRDPKVIIGLYGLNDTTTTLSSWQSKSYGLDRHSLLGDPRFIDSSQGNYRLAANSPALNAGRSLDGKAVHMGAYAIGNEHIGLIPAGSVAAPRAPRLIIAR